MTNEGHEAWRTAVAPGGRADGWALVEAALEAAAAAGADYAEARLVAHVRSGELPRNVSSRASRADRARAADAR